MNDLGIGVKAGFAVPEPPLDLRNAEAMAAYYQSMRDTRQGADEAIEKLREAKARITAAAPQLQALGADTQMHLDGFDAEIRDCYDLKARTHDEDRRLRIARQRKRKTIFKPLLRTGTRTLS